MGMVKLGRSCKTQYLYGDPEWTRTTDLRLRRHNTYNRVISNLYSPNKNLHSKSKSNSKGLFTSIYTSLNEYNGGITGERNSLVWRRLHARWSGNTGLTANSSCTMQIRQEWLGQLQPARHRSLYKHNHNLCGGYGGLCRVKDRGAFLRSSLSDRVGVTTDPHFSLPQKNNPWPRETRGAQKWAARTCRSYASPIPNVNSEIRGVGIWPGLMAAG